jgi:hypothetical protein
VQDVQWQGVLMIRFVRDTELPRHLKEPTRAQLDRCYKGLMKTGMTTHSKVGCVLLPLLNRLEAEGVYYELHAWPGKGYNIKVARD